MNCVGTCSLCGGPVTVPDGWMSIIPPTPTCQSCGAVAAAHGPVIPMQQPVKQYDFFGNQMPPKPPLRSGKKRS